VICCRKTYLAFISCWLLKQIEVSESCFSVIKLSLTNIQLNISIVLNLVTFLLLKCRIYEERRLSSDCSSEH